MAKYTCTVYWTSWAEVEVEAATVEEAVDMLCNAALPPNHQYSDDSFKIVDMINSGSSNADNFLDSNLGWNK